MKTKLTFITFLIIFATTMQITAQIDISSDISIESALSCGGTADQGPLWGVTLTPYTGSYFLGIHEFHTNGPEPAGAGESSSTPIVPPLVAGTEYSYSVMAAIALLDDPTPDWATTGNGNHDGEIYIYAGIGSCSQDQLIGTIQLFTPANLNVWSQFDFTFIATGNYTYMSFYARAEQQDYVDCAYMALDDMAEVLPLELLRFDAELKNKIVELNWTTATEINNDYYTVLKSKDGTKFEEIGTVKAAGNSKSTLNYIFHDNNPYDGISYYKLKQTDFDGSYTFSDIKVIVKEGLELIKIFPIPAEDNITFQVASSENAEMKVKITDDLGQIVYTNIQQISKGMLNQYNINVNSYSAGIYMLEVQTSDGMYKSQKMFVVK